MKFRTPRDHEKASLKGFLRELFGHVIAQLIFGASLLLSFFLNSIWPLLASFVCVGIVQLIKNKLKNSNKRLQNK